MLYLKITVWIYDGVLKLLWATTTDEMFATDKMLWICCVNKQSLSHALKISSVKKILST